MRVHPLKPQAPPPASILTKMGRGLLALKNSFVLMARMSRLKKDFTQRESGLEQLFSELGQATFEAKPNSPIAHEIGILAAKDTLQKASQELEEKKSSFLKQQDSFSLKESEIQKILTAKESIRKQKEDVYNKAYGEFKELENQIKKQRTALVSMEKRKQRAIEFKTMIPVPILTQAQSFAAEKIKKMEREMEVSAAPVEALRSELKTAEEEWMKVKKEWDRYSKDTKAQKNALEDKMNQAEQAKIVAEQELHLLFHDFGKRLEKMGDFAVNTHAFKEKIVRGRGELEDLKRQIETCEKTLEEASRDRKWGLLLVMLLISAIVLACVWVFPRL